MKFTLSWLKEYLETTAPLSEIADKLTAIGLEVEGINDPAARLKDFVVGHVVACQPHPNADKLRCLVVDTGHEKLNVVCGAPNARLGLKGVFAPAGAYIPGLDLTLKKASIRGAESNGMMCSEKELCLSDEHAGIIELPDSAQVGTSAAAALGLDDPVIEINLTPNRGDCAGVYGIARDLAAAGVGRLKTLEAAVVPGSFANPIPVTIEDRTACPLFLGRYIKGVRNRPSPEWMKKRLEAVGQRSISTLVDMTNYLTLALNRPLHVFDADKLKGALQVRAAKAGERLAALNDITYDLTPGMTVVCDDNGVLGLGGIIGGTSTAVDENTTNVYLEAAYFSAPRTAKTGQALRIDSDARYRFDRGIDPAFTAPGVEIATRLILDLCGGVASEVVTAGAVPPKAPTIVYDPLRLKTLGGSDLPPVRQSEILQALGFEVSDTWQVIAPSWRPDIEGAADLVEEILRIEGYDHIPAPDQPVRKEQGQGLSALSPLQQLAAASRRMLAARGLHETVTWAFVPEAAADMFGVDQKGQKAALTLLNPISADMTVMRPSILPHLIVAAGRSADRGWSDVALFEVGTVYHSAEPEGQRMTATGLRRGQMTSRHWSNPPRDVDVFDVKADALAVLEACGVNTAGLKINTEAAPSWYHPGRSGALCQGTLVLAYFGEIHPRVMTSLGRDGETAVAFEIFLQDVPQPRRRGPGKPLLRPSVLQPVVRDFAFVVKDEVSADRLLRAVYGAEKQLITNVELFDVYRGKGVVEGHASLALAVTLQPTEKTLTDADIAAVTQKILEAVAKQTGGVLRG